MMPKGKKAMNYKDLIKKINPERIPKHVAIIMDGNGRWAKKHGKKRIFGHKKGVETVRKIVEVSAEIGIKYLTIYAFSTENWRRSKNEVNYLLKLILDSLLKEIEELIKNNVVIRFIGTEEKLPGNYNKKVNETCKLSWHNNGLNLNVAMNYGGRKEILDAIKKLFNDVQNNKIKLDDLDEKLFSDYLYTAGMPDPDLVIRTSGELRLSNYLIWQTAYSEFWFTDVLWPDFTKADFINAILDYQSRERRFGARK